MKTIISVFMVCSFAIAATSCSSDDEEASLKNFVLIAGSWQGAWVWSDVRSHLEARGHTVKVIELPAHGEDQTPPQDVSMDVYRDKVVDQIRSMSGQVVLVGHSMAGIIISSVSEKIPSRIEKLIYIGAILPANGQSLLDLASTDTQAVLGRSIIPSEDNLTLDVVHDRITDIFCQDGSIAMRRLILEKFRLEPAIPFADKVTLTDDNFGKVRKYFIHTELDSAVGIDLQKRMVTAAGEVKTYSLRSGHSPHLTMPARLTSLLVGISRDE